MESKSKQERRARIETAAYVVLMRDGYKATTMLAIAKQAGCSNETLYRWYGNKQGLFAALVVSNAESIKARISQAIEIKGDTLEELRLIGALVLKLVSSPRAVALNRAAAGDVYDTKTLGPAIAAGGKDAVAPLIGSLIENGLICGHLNGGTQGEILGIFLNVLVGDVQIQRAIGVITRLSENECAARADRAVNVVAGLFT